MTEEINDILRAELESLAGALRPRGVPLIIGGGYGLLLRQEHIAYSGVRTVREIPEARSTNDLDIFLSVEIVTNAAKMGALRDVLHESGYTPIPGAQHSVSEGGDLPRNSADRQGGPPGATAP